MKHRLTPRRGHVVSGGQMPAARSIHPAPDSLSFSLLNAAVLVAAVRTGQTLTAAMEALWSSRDEWTPAQRGAIQDLAYACLRHFGQGDAWLERLLATPAPPLIHALLLVAIDRLQAKPDQAHTIVNQAVDAAGIAAPGLKALVNGVLRNVLREQAKPPQSEEATYCHPSWWITKLRKACPANWEDILAAGNAHPPMTLRTNVRRTTPAGMADALDAAGLGVRRNGAAGLTLAKPLPVQRLPGFIEGLVSVQDAGAQYAAGWLDLQAGQRVLDACAAPGGKAAHILESCDVDLLALELDARRAERIRENFQRLGLQGRIQVADCTDLAGWWDGRPFARILADVPCSASGVLRRHPDIKWLRRPEDIARFVAQQSRILNALWQTLAPGGKMLYVTCSVFPEENRVQIADFLGRHKDALVLPIEGQTEQQMLPDADHDGFYYALLHKQA
jgi:16S rRNA (cytosine967-C5)-methyltransferase